MAVPNQELSIESRTSAEADPSLAAAPGPRRPSRLGLVLAACLLLGLLAWRRAIPDASPWLDIAALAAAWAFLLAVRTLLQKRGRR
jgi:hypothetical protein